MRSDVLLSAGGNGVMVATPGKGDAWAVTRALQGEDVRTVANDPHHPGRAFAGLAGGGVHRSDDGGRTWRPAGLPGETVMSLHVSQADGATYAGTRPPHVHRSRDGGGTWERIEGFDRIPMRRLWLSPAEPPFRGYVQALAGSAGDAGTLLAGIEVGGVRATHDAGGTWRKGKNAIYDCHSLAAHPVDGDRFYQGGAGRAPGAWSEDGGRTWTKVRGDDLLLYGWATAPHPRDPDVWYVSAAKGPGRAHGAGPAGARIYRVEDGRAHRVDDGGPDGLAGMPYALLTDAGDPDGLLACLADGSVRASPDLGETWTTLPLETGRVGRAWTLLEGTP